MIGTVETIETIDVYISIHKNSKIVFAIVQPRIRLFNVHKTMLSLILAFCVCGFFSIHMRWDFSHLNIEE